MPLVHQLHHPDKNTGTNTTANVAVIISPIIPVPMACGSPNWPRQEEGQGRHDDRAQECGLKRCVDQVTALVMQDLGKLDDQERVLGRQADDGHQPILKNALLGTRRNDTASIAPSTPVALPATSPRRRYRPLW